MVILLEQTETSSLGESLQLANDSKMYFDCKLKYINYLLHADTYVDLMSFKCVAILCLQRWLNIKLTVCQHFVFLLDYI